MVQGEHKNNTKVFKNIYNLFKSAKWSSVHITNILIICRSLNKCCFCNECNFEQFIDYNNLNIKNEKFMYNFIRFKKHESQQQSTVVVPQGNAFIAHPAYIFLDLMHKSCIKKLSKNSIFIIKCRYILYNEYIQQFYARIFKTFNPCIFDCTINPLLSLYDLFSYFNIDMNTELLSETPLFFEKSKNWCGNDDVCNSIRQNISRYFPYKNVFTYQTSSFYFQNENNPSFNLERNSIFFVCRTKSLLSKLSKDLFVIVNEDNSEMNFKDNNEDKNEDKNEDNNEDNNEVNNEVNNKMNNEVNNKMNNEVNNKMNNNNINIEPKFKVFSTISSCLNYISLKNNFNKIIHRVYLLDQQYFEPLVLNEKHFPIEIYGVYLPQFYVFSGSCISVNESSNSSQQLPLNLLISNCIFYQSCKSYFKLDNTSCLEISKKNKYISKLSI